MWHRISPLLAIGITIGALDLCPAAAQSYSYPRADQAAATRMLKWAVVRIFAGELETAHRGSGFVVDSVDGLIATAAHVVDGLSGQAWVALPGRSDKLPVRVLTRSIRDDVDFALLQFEGVPQGLGALELHLDLMGDGGHLVTGFGRDGDLPVPASVQQSRQGECRYLIRVPTVHGDSGSAVLTEEGLAAGIAVHGRESGGGSSMSQTVVLPLSCVKDTLLSVVSDGDEEAILDAMRRDAWTRQNSFQPPPTRSRWYSNLRLSKALHRWAARRNQDPTVPLLADWRQMQEIGRIIVDRRLGYDLLMEVTAQSSPTKFTAADYFQRLGDTSLAAGDRQVASRSYAVAQNLYVSHAVERLPAEWGQVAVEAAQNLEAAKAFKSAADSLTKLAKLEENSDLFRQAADFAAAAAFHAPEGRLKASAFATFGAASFGAGDTALAGPAFRSAIAAGETAAWTRNSLQVTEALTGKRNPGTLDPTVLGERAGMVAKSGTGASNDVLRILGFPVGAP